MKHREKLRIARKMRTRAEIKNRTPVFQTKWWELRKEAKELKTFRLGS